MDTTSHIKISLKGNYTIKAIILVFQEIIVNLKKVYTREFFINNTRYHICQNRVMSGKDSKIAKVRQEKKAKVD